MTKVKRGNVARKRRKKILKFTESFRGSSSKIFRTANQQYLKALKFAYRDRNEKKRNFRSLWIIRLNAAVRMYKLNYNKFIHGLKKSNIIINRKILSQLAICDSQSFQKIILILERSHQ